MATITAMTASYRKQLTAWLGMLAMWLIVCAPAISQLLVHARGQEPIADICSVLRPSSASAPLSSLPASQATRGSSLGPSIQSFPRHTLQRPLAWSGSGVVQHVVKHVAMHDMPAGSLGACGYCDLFAHHVPAPALPPATLSVVAVLVAVAAATLSTHFTPLGAFPSGRPRGPPLVS
jgi:hypothetical protein